MIFLKSVIKMSNQVLVSVRIPIEDNKTIEKLVKRGKYINKSDFFRKAIKRLLEEDKA